MTAPDAPSVPATSSPEETLRALADAAIVRWWQTTAFLAADGPDAATLLDGLCTQAVERIESRTGVPGLFLDAKAKIIAPAILHRMTGERFLLETLPELVEPLQAHLRRYRLRAKVELEPTDDATIALVGGAPPPQLPDRPDGAWSHVRGAGRDTLAWIGSAGSCAELVNSLGLPLADPDALEADRIEHAVAGLHDLLPGRMPAEVGGMETAVALDAGCYLGQEPVARLHYRGHANRTLRRLEATGSIDPGTPLEGDAHLELRPAGEPDARAVGRLTTWASTGGSRTVALAMVRRELPAGTELALPGTDALLRLVDDAPT